MFRRWIWFAMACAYCSMLLVIFVTIEWTPDCGGIVYGLPLPFLSTCMASSWEFNFFVGPFLIDTLTYTLVVSIPAWLIVRHVRRQSVWRRRLYASTLFLLVGFASVVGASMMVAINRMEVWPREQLYVNEWRTKRLYVGPPSWVSHLEDQCN